MSASKEQMNQDASEEVEQRLRAVAKLLVHGAIRVFASSTNQERGRPSLEVRLKSQGGIQPFRL